jgi:hypothetical protein
VAASASAPRSVEAARMDLVVVKFMGIFLE